MRPLNPAQRAKLAFLRKQAQGNMANAGALKTNMSGVMPKPISPLTPTPPASPLGVGAPYSSGMSSLGNMLSKNRGY